MCDYSLMTVPNRLANQGEELVTHRFATGSLGFASPKDLCIADAPQPRAEGIWSVIRKIFNPLPKAETVPAVCIPPGARLVLQDISTRLQRSVFVQRASGSTPHSETETA